MLEYVNVVMILNFLIDLLLLMGTNRLCGTQTELWSVILASSVGGVYSGACLLRSLGFLSGFLCRALSLVFIAVIAFGWRFATVRKGSVYILLRMSLGGLAASFSGFGIVSFAFSAIVILILCFTGFGSGPASPSLIPVEMVYSGRRVQFTALRDTGNLLRDPVSGSPVMIVDANIAAALTGLTREQLSKPADAMLSSAISGLRMIPYRTVGQNSGLLLALRIPEVKIGKQKGSQIVAFSPVTLGEGDTYQALTGGIV